MAYLLLTLAGITFLVIVALLRKVPLGRRSVPPWAAFLGAGAALAGGLGCVAVFDPAVLGLPRGRTEPARDPLPVGSLRRGRPAPTRDPLPVGSYREGPLAVGEKVPLLEAAGWLNGPPPRPGTQGPRLIVLDVWAHW
jgi:hypothetical protein